MDDHNRAKFLHICILIFYTGCDCCSYIPKGLGQPLALVSFIPDIIIEDQSSASIKLMVSIKMCSQNFPLSFAAVSLNIFLVSFYISNLCGILSSFILGVHHYWRVLYGSKTMRTLNKWPKELRAE